MADGFKKQGHFPESEVAISRQLQEMERSMQESLGKVETNAPMGVTKLNAGTLSNGDRLKFQLQSSRERVRNNGNDTNGDELGFDKPGYYLVAPNLRFSSDQGSSPDGLDVCVFVDDEEQARFNGRNGAQVIKVAAGQKVRMNTAVDGAVTNASMEDGSYMSAVFIRPLEDR